MTARECLRAAYGKSPLTQDQIAARAGVSPNTVYRALAGREVSATNFLAIAQALGLSVKLTDGTTGSFTAISGEI